MRVMHAVSKPWLGILLALCLLASSVARAGDEENRTDSQPQWMELSAPPYEPGDLPDPFTPFFQTAPGTEQVPTLEQARPLTPLERVEISQLTLVGIMWDPDTPEQNRAMVELPDGKGFILELGTRIGPNQGEVIRILRDQVEIKERIPGPYGQTQEKLEILDLRPREGERDG